MAYHHLSLQIIEYFLQVSLNNYKKMRELYQQGFNVFLTAVLKDNVAQAAVSCRAFFASIKYCEIHIW